MFEAISNKYLSHPRKLFLIDGFGALLSSFLLGVVLVKFQDVVGIPYSTLYFLAALPILFALYDFYYFKKVNLDVSKYLKGIAITNILYCILSLGLAFYHSNLITIWGWSYIIVEIIIVLILTLVEFDLAKKLSQKASVN